MFKRFEKPKGEVDIVIDSLANDLKKRINELIEQGSLAETTIITHEVKGVAKVYLSFTVELEGEEE